MSSYFADTTLASVRHRGLFWQLELPFWALPEQTLRLLKRKTGDPFGHTAELLVCSPMSNVRQTIRAEDPREMRDAFLQLKRDTEALLTFLNDWKATWVPTRSAALYEESKRENRTYATQQRGYRLQSAFEPRKLPADIVGAIYGDKPQFPSTGLLNYVLPSEIWNFREQCFEALTKPPYQWLLRHKQLWFLAPRSKYPHQAFVAHNCRDAITNCIAIDLLNKEKFAICARADCRGWFRIKSRHKRMYCCQYCAHLESVRRNRQKA